MLCVAGWRQRPLLGGARLAGRPGSRALVGFLGVELRGLRHGGCTAAEPVRHPPFAGWMRPVRVLCLLQQVFHSRVQPSIDTLLKWDARDNDRTMLYGAEVKIKLK